MMGTLAQPADDRSTDAKRVPTERAFCLGGRKVKLKSCEACWMDRGRWQGWRLLLAVGHRTAEVELKGSELEEAELGDNGKVHDGFTGSP
jgi:hypothetical protein